MFRPMLRPGQGFKRFRILERVGVISEKGRPVTSSKANRGEFMGIISQADPKEVEQAKQAGSPITHTIVQHGSSPRAGSNDILELPGNSCGDKARKFMVRGEPKDPGELGHVLIYKVEERTDLK